MNRVRRSIVLMGVMVAGAPVALSRTRTLPAYDVVELGAAFDREASTGALAISVCGRAAGWANGRPAVFADDGRASLLSDRPGVATGFDRDGRVTGRLFGWDGEPPVAFVSVGSGLIESSDVAVVDAQPSPGREQDALALALPAASFSQMYGRNDRGETVGTSDTGIGTEQRAVLRSRAALVDLGQLAAVRAAGWRSLLAAYAINDRGTIVGVGERADGAVRGFMLVVRTS